MAFVDAAARIQKEIPDCRFLIQGAALFETREAARYEREVRRAAAGLPIEFHKWDSDIYSVFPKLDLVVVPSAPYEATTRVILEAFSAGVPVVARESGGIPEVVDHGLNGYLARNDDELARFAIELLTGPGERWVAMAQEARASWGRRFTLSRYRRQVMDLLARAAKN